MSWNTLPPHIQEAAEKVLTQGQLQVFKLELAGLSKRGIALHLDLPRTTVYDRLQSTERTLRLNGITQDEFGRWHTTERTAA